MRVVFKHFPLDFHKQARDAARFAILAQEKGKFWEVHDKLFENTRNINEARFLEIAKEVGIPEAEVKAVLAEKRYEDRINAEMAEGKAGGVKGTPGNFVNGIWLRGAQPYEKFKATVEEALKRDNLGLDAYPVDNPQPPPPPADVGKIPAGNSPVLGKKNAAVSVVVFSDFQ